MEQRRHTFMTECSGGERNRGLGRGSLVPQALKVLGAKLSNVFYSLTVPLNLNELKHAQLRNFPINSKWTLVSAWVGI